jgi:hypothetical protein
MKATLFLVAGVFFVSGSFAQIAPTESNLRTAVAAGGTITFTGSGVIGLNAPIAVTVNTTIDAAGNNITIDGQGKTNLFRVENGVQFTLRNLTLANGLAKGPDGSRAVKYGAAIQSDGGLVAAENVVFTNNLAVGGSSTTMPFERPVTSGGEAMGGAIWQNGGSLTVVGGAFLNNSAKGGVGIGFQPGRGGAVFGMGGALSIFNVAFAGNLALGGPNRDQFPGGVGAGGAIYSSNQVYSVVLGYIAWCWGGLRTTQRRRLRCRMGWAERWRFIRESAP